MLVISEVGGSIQVVLGTSVTTNELECYSSWRHRTASLPEGRDSGDTALYTRGTDPINIVPGPDKNSQRLVDFLSIYNADTVDHTVMVYRNSRDNLFTLWKGDLAPEEAMYYIDGYGFTSNTTSPLFLRSVRTP